MGKEVWRTIDGFPLYEISNLGRVKSHFRKKERILKGQDNGSGYVKHTLRNGNLKKRMYAHRLVAKAFIENPEGKPFVNHIDNDPANNSAENLEWVTHQENIDWMAAQRRNRRTKEWLDHLHAKTETYRKPVIGTNIVTGEKVSYPYINSVMDDGFQASCVSQCCNGIRNTHKGYRWEYAR